MPNSIAKPFLKWAGGKTQLIDEIENQLPENLSEIPFTYIEPFVGSGAVFFWMIEKFPNIEKVVINDINSDLTNCYLTIKDDLDDLLTTLSMYQLEYHSVFKDKELAKEYFYDKRLLFNTRKSTQNYPKRLVYIFE